LLFLWYPCFTKLPDKKENVQDIRKRRGIGGIIFSMRRAGAVFIISAPGKFKV
jgi:hypothetical protein